MSYSVDEGITDTKDRLRDLKKVKELFPNARLDSLPNGEKAWIDGAARNDATDVRALADKSGLVWFCPYVNVGDTCRVYVDVWHAGVASAVLVEVREKNPDAYRALVRVASGATSTSGEGGG